jgi:hypothetical protein
MLIAVVQLFPLISSDKPQKIPQSPQIQYNLHKEGHILYSTASVVSQRQTIKNKRRHSLGMLRAILFFNKGILNKKGPAEIEDNPAASFE